MSTNLRIVAFLLVSLYVAGCNPAGDHSPIAAHETAYERVMRTGELRCGYYSWNPAFIKNPNTGEMSGISHDYVEELGKVLKLKIVWAE